MKILQLFKSRTVDMAAFMVDNCVYCEAVCFANGRYFVVEGNILSPNHVIHYFTEEQVEEYMKFKKENTGNDT